jgi:hypothetical protein
LPPLVYQLGLLPMGVTSSFSLLSLSSLSSSSSLGGGQESERHRGMRLQLMCLEGIANSLDDDDDDNNDGGCGKGRDPAAIGDNDNMGQGNGLTP